MTFAARFAENLTQARRLAGLIQEQVATRASISRGAVSKYELGAHVPSIDIVIRLGGALAVAPADLLDGIAYRPGFIGLGEGRYEFDGPAPNDAETCGE